MCTHPAYCYLLPVYRLTFSATHYKIMGVIKTFKDPETRRLYQRQRSRKLPANIQQVALRKLRMINNAININDLRVPPANRLEKLSGNRTGQ